MDQMIRCYSVKAGSRRWPVHVFYNVIDLALVNSWIVFKHVCKSNISRRDYIQLISEELTGNTPQRKNEIAANPRENCAPPPNKIRKTCLSKKCKNRTTDVCELCNKPVCGKCTTKQCRLCNPKA